MKSAVVTGAAGFLARHLASALHRRGECHVAGADVQASAAPGFDEWYVTDLTDPAATRRMLLSVRPSTVFHLVGRIRGTDAEIRFSNVNSTRILLEAALELETPPRVVLVGSAAEYGAVPASAQPVRETFDGAPTGAYGKAKKDVSSLAAEYARDRAFPVVVARPFNAIGSGVGEALVVGALTSRLRAALAGQSPRRIRVGTTTSIRDFVAADDVAEGFVLAAERGRPGEAYNLCSGEGHAVSEVLEKLLALAGEPVAVERDESLVRTGEVDSLVGSWEKAGRELGWRPTISIGESLRAAWESAVPVTGRSL